MNGWIEAKMKKVQLEGSSSWIFRIVQPPKVEKCSTDHFFPYEKPARTKIAVFKIVQKGAGSQNHVQKNYYKFVKASVREPFKNFLADFVR